MKCKVIQLTGVLVVAEPATIKTACKVFGHVLLEWVRKTSENPHHRNFSIAKEYNLKDLFPVTCFENDSDSGNLHEYLLFISLGLIHYKTELNLPDYLLEIDSLLHSDKKYKIGIYDFIYDGLFKPTDINDFLRSGIGGLGNKMYRYVKGYLPYTLFEKSFDDVSCLSNKVWQGIYTFCNDKDCKESLPFIGAFLWRLFRVGDPNKWSNGFAKERADEFIELMDILIKNSDHFILYEAIRDNKVVFEEYINIHKLKQRNKEFSFKEINIYKLEHSINDYGYFNSQFLQALYLFTKFILAEEQITYEKIKNNYYQEQSIEQPLEKPANTHLEELCELLNIDKNNDPASVLQKAREAMIKLHPDRSKEQYNDKYFLKLLETYQAAVEESKK